MATVTQIQVRRDTAADWSSANPTLASGEIGHETDTGLFKIGDGSTAWNDLEYENNIINSVTQNIWLPFSGIKVPPSQAASFVSHGIGGAWEFSDGRDDTVVFNIQQPIDMDNSTSPSLFVRWSSAATTGNAVWQLEYLWRSVDEDTTAAAQETLSITVSPSSTANGLISSEFSGIDSPVSVDRFLHCRLKRLGADGSDDLGDTAELHGIYLQYTADKLGG